MIFLAALNRRGIRRLKHNVSLSKIRCFQPEALPVALCRRNFQEVHFRRAHKARNKEICRLQVEIHGPPDLLDLSAIENDDLVRKRHRLDLVVRDIDHRGLQIIVELRNLDAHLDAQFGVKVGERFVEEEDFRLSHDRPTDRDSLTLATR